MTTREQFIGTISKALGRTEAPAIPARLIYRHSVHTDVMRDWSQDDLARAFIEYSQTIGAVVCETIREELNDTILKTVAEYASGPVILAKDSLLNELDTAAVLEKHRTVRVWNTGDSRENNIRYADPDN